MKFNWGTGIALFYSIFALSLVFVLFKSMQYDNSLVSDHYYADDLNYQSHYDKLKNSKMLKEDLKIWNKLQSAEVELAFPHEVGAVQGEIHFFCPSDSKQDFKLPIQADENNLQRVPTKGLKQGLWKVKVDWQAGGRTYFKEEAITI
jgi:nitrogen fixation protein FixH